MYAGAPERGPPLEVPHQPDRPGVPAAHEPRAGAHSAGSERGQPGGRRPGPQPGPHPASRPGAERSLHLQGIAACGGHVRIRAIRSPQPPRARASRVPQIVHSGARRVLFLDSKS